MQRNFDHGCAIFTQTPGFAAQGVARCLEPRRDIRSVVIVYHERFTASEMVAALRMATARETYCIPFAEFDSPATSDLLSAIPLDSLCLVAVDLCRMLSNRLDTRLDKIQVRLKAAAKICIDPVPYLARPWQVYFPYSLLNKTWLGYNHSYAIEGEWKKYKEGLRDDPCRVELIAPQIAPATLIDYCCYFDQPLEVYTEAVSEKVKAEYEAYKAKLLAEESGIASVLTKLHKFVQAWCPQRTLPLDLKKMYQPGFGRIVKTDLKLDDYLFGEMTAIIEHSNALTRRLKDAQSDF